MTSETKISLLHPDRRDPDDPDDDDKEPPPRRHGVRAQNRRQKLAFLIGTIVLTILIVAGVRYYLHSVRPLRVAAGPVGTVEYRFAEKFAKLVRDNTADLRLSIIADESPAAAALRFARGDAELGFVRTDQKVPGSARALALLEHFAFFLVVPKGSKVANLADLRGKKVAFVTSESGADALFRSILAASQIDSDRITLQSLPGESAIDALFMRDQFQAAVVFASLSALAETKRFDRLTKVEVKAIEGSKALERKIAGLTSETIEAGLLSGNPKLPDDDLETVGVQEFMTVRRRLSNTIVAELAGVILENKNALAIDNTFANRI